MRAYHGRFKDLIAAYKFGRRPELAPFFAALAAARLSMEFPGRVLVPVPPRPGKLRSLGWDQVELVSRILERGYGVRVARVLRRLPAGEQKRLGRQERFRNAESAYGMARGRSAPPDPVLLDDIITTGATLSACAAALKRAGARRVDALALAAD